MWRGSQKLGRDDGLQKEMLNSAEMAFGLSTLHHFTGIKTSDKRKVVLLLTGALPSPPTLGLPAEVWSAGPAYQGIFQSADTAVTSQPVATITS